MDWHSLWWLLAAVLVITGLIGAVLPVLPGPIVVFAGLWLAGWIEDYHYLGGKSLIFLAVMMLIAHALDMLAGVLGAKAGGASKKAILGATLGVVIGVFFGLPGLLLGPVTGALLGEMLHQQDLPKAARAGVGAGLGVVIGMAVKIAISFAMVGWYLWVRFF